MEDIFMEGDDFYTNEDFYYFLVDNNILDKFTSNFDTDYIYTKTKMNVDSIYDFLIRCDRRDYIYVSFDWNSTEDGYSFWNTHSNNWKSIVS